MLRPSPSRPACFIMYARPDGWSYKTPVLRYVISVTVNVVLYARSRAPPIARLSRPPALTRWLWALLILRQARDQDSDASPFFRSSFSSPLRADARRRRREEQRARCAAPLHRQLDGGAHARMPPGAHCAPTSRCAPSPARARPRRRRPTSRSRACRGCHSSGRGTRRTSPRCSSPRCTSRSPPPAAAARRSPPSQTSSTRSSRRSRPMRRRATPGAPAPSTAGTPSRRAR